MENMLMADTQGRMLLQTLQRLLKVRVEGTELRGSENEHAHAAPLRIVVIHLGITEGATPPYTIMPEVFAVVTDVHVEEGAALQLLRHAADALIRVVNGVVVGVFHLRSLSARVLKLTDKGGKGCSLFIEMIEGRVAAFIVDEEK